LYSPEDFEAGLMQLTSLSTINPNIQLVIEAVIITAYWIICSI